jgi:hypothetical protein
MKPFTIQEWKDYFKAHPEDHTDKQRYPDGDTFQMAVEQTLKDLSFVFSDETQIENELFRIFGKPNK